MSSNSLPWHSAAVLMVLAGLAVIVLGYSRVAPTFDEPAHIGCGLQFVATGKYLYEPQHPPLARLVIALPAYLAGVEYKDTGHMVLEGNAALSQGEDFKRTLLLFRVGILLFYVLGCWGVYAYAGFLPGPARLAALAFMAFSPSVVAHSGLATTDAACMALFALTILAAVRYAGKPGLKTVSLFGLAMGLGLLTKHSFLSFIVPFLVLFGVYCYFTGHMRGRMRLRDGFLLAGMVFLVLFVGYGGEIGPIDLDRAYLYSPKVYFSLSAYKGFFGLPIFPFPQYFAGLIEVVAHNDKGHGSFFLGQVYQHGHWLYFPVLLLLKPTLPFLIGWFAGAALRLRDLGRSRTPHLELDTALLAVLAVLGVAVTANINIGIRHLLPAFPFMAVLAGFTVAKVLGLGRPVLACLLPALHLAIFAFAFPRYISYYNCAPLCTPENIAVDSNYDWGQDQYQLLEYLAKSGRDMAYIAEIPRLPIAADLPLQIHYLDRDVFIPQGLLATSLTFLKTFNSFKEIQMCFEPIHSIAGTIIIFDTADPTTLKPQCRQVQPGSQGQAPVFPNFFRP